MPVLPGRLPFEQVLSDSERRSMYDTTGCVDSEDSITLCVAVSFRPRASRLRRS